jgi:hypothetical protein
VNVVVRTGVIEANATLVTATVVDMMIAKIYVPLENKKSKGRTYEGKGCI